MTKIATLITLVGLVLTHSYAIDPANVWHRCSQCHGAKADKWVGEVPPLKMIDSQDRLKYMQEYSQGKRSAYGQGALMKINLRGLTMEDFVVLEKYIDSL